MNWLDAVRQWGTFVFAMVAAICGVIVIYIIHAVTKPEKE